MTKDQRNRFKKKLIDEGIHQTDFCSRHRPVIDYNHFSQAMGRKNPRAMKPEDEVAVLKYIGDTVAEESS